MSSAETTPTEATSQASPDPAIVTEGPAWQDQDSMLRDMWMQNNTPQAIAEALNRSIPAVMTRAARLGLPRRSAPGRKPGQRPLNDSIDQKQLTKTRGAKTPSRISESAALQTSQRVCLMCLTSFESLGRHNRICPSCKGTAEYQTGFSMPDIDIPGS